MTVRFHYDRTGHDTAWHLPGLAAECRNCLWFARYSPDPGQFDLTAIADAFSPLRGILWFAPASEFINRDAGANQDGLHISHLATITSEFPTFKRTDVSSVVQLSNDTRILARILGDGRVRSQLVLGFIPNEISARSDWVRIVHGAHWLWVCSKWIANAPEPTLDSWAVAATIVNLVGEIGGVTGLRWVDSNMDRGFAFLGPATILDSVVSRISSDDRFYEDDGLIVDRNHIGYSFELCG
jgi:hypothetical protein